MTERELEDILRDLPNRATLVKDRGYRQVWRFELGGRGYYLKFYPRAGSRLKRLVRGSPAWREFRRLQWLQKAQVPAPHAQSFLSGFRLGERVGDAVVLDAIEPGMTLDRYLNDLELRGEAIPDHRELSRQLRGLVHQLGEAKLGHGDLHLGNVLRRENRLYLLDGYAVRRGGLRQNDVMLLADSVRRYATRADLRRGWEQLGAGPMPARNPVARAVRRKLLKQIWGENRYFGRLGAGAWSGVFFRQFKYPYRWSKASHLTATDKDWQTAWPRLLAQIESDQLEIIKRSRSGDVLGGEVVVGGLPLAVIVKRPKRRYWYRYVNEIGRGSRARRAWGKAWKLVFRGTPTAWPLMLMEKRVMGYVTDAVIVFERVPGATLADVKLEEMEAAERDTLMRRTGRLLRELEGSGLYHWDAKATNWIVLADEKRGPMPVLVDVDGIRGHWGVGEGVRRLLRSMREHPQYTPADSLALCQGYAPFARLYREEGRQSDEATERRSDEGEEEEQS